MGTFTTGIPLTARDIQPPLIPVVGITINKVVVDGNGDAVIDTTNFLISITLPDGDILSGIQLSSDKPFSISGLQYGVYTVSEEIIINVLSEDGITPIESEDGTPIQNEEVSYVYSLVSITPSTFTLSAGNPHQDVDIINSKDAVITPIKYGALYNWYAAVYSTGGANIAPSGWHVPSKAEFDTLVTELGGDTVAGGHLKQTGTTYWVTESAGTDNSSGFNLRGSGKRYGDTGTFTSLNVLAMIWNTTAGYNIFYTSDSTDSFTNSSNDNTVGLSIRLIKDDSTDPGAMTDYDGNIYPTVKIGNQVWMAANLAVTHYNDGTPIPNITDNGLWAADIDGAYCWYDNDINNK